MPKKFFNKKNKNTKRRLYIFLKFIYCFSDVSLKINLPILSSQNEVLVINTDNNPAYPDDYGSEYPGFALSQYTQRSGEVLYMNRFDSVERTESSKEQFKILLEF